VEIGPWKKNWCCRVRKIASWRLPGRFREGGRHGDIDALRKQRRRICVLRGLIQRDAEEHRHASEPSPRCQGGLAPPLLVTARERPKTAIPDCHAPATMESVGPHGRKPKGFLRDTASVKEGIAPGTGQVALTATPLHLKGQKIAIHAGDWGLR